MENRVYENGIQTSIALLLDIQTNEEVVVYIEDPFYQEKFWLWENTLVLSMYVSDKQLVILIVG